MPRYLSAEWFADAQRALAAAAPTDGTADFVVQHEVLAGPEGDVTFHVVHRDGALRIERGPAAAPTVTFTQPWDTAVAIARGELSAQRAFMDGRVRVRGDLAALVDGAPLLAALDAALAELRGRTEYERVETS